MSEQQAEYKFSGFDQPSENYSKLPHALISCLPEIETVAELKVVIYILRHTWGFSEYEAPKKITTDEFMNGRKKRDGSRMDSGTGLSNNSVITGLEKAVEHGFILVDVDETDKARIEKHYKLSMSDVQSLHSYPQSLHSCYANIAHRSEKDTKGKKLKKDKEGAAPKTPKASDFPSNVLFREVTERWPAKANWNTVLQKVFEVEKRLGRVPAKDDLFPFYEAWCGNGWRVDNIAWLDYASRGELPGRFSNKPIPAEPKGFEAVRKFMSKYGGTNG